MPRMQIYFNKTEYDYVKEQDPGFVRDCVRDAMYQDDKDTLVDKEEK